jgi:hypothetical protein
MAGIVEESVRQEKREYAPVSEEYIESRRLRGREDTLLELRDGFLAQVSYDHAQNDPQKQKEIAQKVAQWSTDTVNAEEKNDLANLKHEIHPADAAFREGQREGIKEFEAKHGLGAGEMNQVEKLEQLLDHERAAVDTSHHYYTKLYSDHNALLGALTRNISEAENRISEHWVKHPDNDPAYYRGVTDSVNSLHALVKKHAPELAQDLPPKLSFSSIENKVGERLAESHTQSLSFGVF